MSEEESGSPPASPARSPRLAERERVSLTEADLEASSPSGRSSLTTSGSSLPPVAPGGRLFRMGSRTPSSPQLVETGPAESRGPSARKGTATAAPEPATMGGASAAMASPVVGTATWGRGASKAINEWAIVKAQGYTGVEASEISLTPGERVLVLRAAPVSGMLVGRTDAGEEGMFPAVAVEMAPRAASPPSGRAVNQPRARTLKESLAQTISVAKSKGEKAMAATKSAAVKANKVLQKGKERIAQRGRSGSASSHADKDKSISAHHFVFDGWVGHPEMEAWTWLIMDAVVRPVVSQRIEDERQQRMARPVVLKAGMVDEVFVDPAQPLADADVWKLYSHLATSVGLEPATGLDMDDLREHVKRFALFLGHATMGGGASNASSRHQMLKFLALLHRQRMRPSNVMSSLMPPTAILLCLLALEGGALCSPDAFRAIPDDDELETLRAMIEDGALLSEPPSCVAASYMLLEWIKERTVFSSYEACASASSDPVKVEEMFLALPAVSRDLLVLLCSFFRLFRHFSATHGLTVSAIVALLANALIADPVASEDPTDGAAGSGGTEGDVNEFVATLLQVVPAHLVAESAIGYEALVASQHKGRKSATGRIIGFDAEKRRYLVALHDPPSEFYVKERHMEWLHYGNLPLIPHLAPLFFAGMVPPLVAGERKGALAQRPPLQQLTDYYDPECQGVSESRAKGTGSTGVECLFENDCALSVQLLEALAIDTTHRQCILATAKALALVFLHYGRDGLFASRLVTSFVDREIAETPQLSTLFRGNSTASRLLSAFLSVAGQALLQRLRVPLMHMVNADAQVQARLAREGAGSSNANGGPSDDRSSLNADEVPAATEDFSFVAHHATAVLDAIVGTASSFPNAVRKLLLRVGDACETQFSSEPNARAIALGGVVFLRFFGPALLSPLEFGLVDAPLSASAQRVLVLITSAITVLANQTSFAASKPSHALNELFVERSRARVVEFLEQCQRVPQNVFIAPSAVSKEQCDEAYIALLTTRFAMGI